MKYITQVYLRSVCLYGFLVGVAMELVLGAEMASAAVFGWHISLFVLGVAYLVVVCFQLVFAAVRLGVAVYGSTDLR